jgi:hypothetical protein
VVAIKELFGFYRGENMAAVIVEMLKDYNITNKLGYIMSDNVYVNDTYSRSLSTYLELHGIRYNYL